MKNKFEKTIELLQSVYGKEHTFEELLNKQFDYSNDKVVKLFLNMLQEIYNNRMPFNKYIGVNVEGPYKPDYYRY